MSTEEHLVIYPKSKQEWRDWLLENHTLKNAVWVVFYKKKVNKPTISWSDSVDEALCFGWIDSVKKTMDAERSVQFFSKRKPNSTWSKINKLKVELLIEEGRMTKAGSEQICKKNVAPMGCIGKTTGNPAEQNQRNSMECIPATKTKTI
ncbi:hypothetical protein ANCCEY_15252 [Ancylostoma ceylanicum]|uniref:Bacteriocin-protection protein n=1 Tax=Ancylostoma ceylanicum TaxID=53326 RepID=A0A0D6L7W9_9BILA|nr:hypothetical protein ANCCEY_15252 [Ancylostoma ceylanicum]